MSQGPDNLTLAPPIGRKCPAIFLMRSIPICSAEVPQDSAARFWLLTGRSREGKHKPSTVSDRACCYSYRLLVCYKVSLRPLSVFEGQGSGLHNHMTGDAAAAVVIGVAADSPCLSHSMPPADVLQLSQSSSRRSVRGFCSRTETLECVIMKLDCVGWYHVLVNQKHRV
jgi:hypothetical protein